MSFDQLNAVLNKVFNATPPLVASDDGASPEVESMELPVPSPADGTNFPEVASTDAPVAAPITKWTEFCYFDHGSFATSIVMPLYVFGDGCFVQNKFGNLIPKL